MPKIKIAQVITRMDWGGSPDIVSILCQRLDREKYDIRLICGVTVYPSGKNKEFFKKFEGNIFRLTRLKRNVNIFNDVFSFFSLYRLFRRERFDIVHTHTTKAGVLGRISAVCAGVPAVIHSPHGHIFYGYFGPLVSKAVVVLERFMTHFTDKIIALTELEKRDLVTFKVAGPEKIVVINSGLELNNYRKINVDTGRIRDGLGLEEDMALAGFVGRLEPVKGPEYFIRAAALVAGELTEVKFLIVGEGSLRNKLESECEKSGIRDKVIFTGWREDITEILSILNVLVLPSLNEAVGRVLIEAGACGVPVVAARVGGVPEVVKDNQTGILVPPGEPEALAGAMIALLEDKEKRQRMGERAENWVGAKFGVNKMVERVSSLYHEIRGGK